MNLCLCCCYYYCWCCYGRYCRFGRLSLFLFFISVDCQMYNNNYERACFHPKKCLRAKSQRLNSNRSKKRQPSGGSKQKSTQTQAAKHIYLYVYNISQRKKKKIVYCRLFLLSLNSFRFASFFRIFYLLFWLQASTNSFFDVLVSFKHTHTHTRAISCNKTFTFVEIYHNWYDFKIRFFFSLQNNKSMRLFNAFTISFRDFFSLLFLFFSHSILENFLSFFLLLIYCINEQCFVWTL